jgi:hypothetical protein
MGDKRSRLGSQIVTWVSNCAAAVVQMDYEDDE